MRKFINTITFLLVAAVLILSCTSCDGQGKDSVSAGKTSTTTYNYIKKISMVQPKKALKMLNQEERRHTMSNIDVNMLRSIVYYNATQEYDKVLKYAEKALNDLDINKHPEKKQKLLDIIASQYYECGEYSKCLQAADEGITLANKLGDRYQTVVFLMIIGQCHSEIGNSGYALGTYDRCIQIITEERKIKKDWSTQNSLVTAYALKADLLTDLEDYTAVLKLKNDYEEALNGLKDFNTDLDGGSDMANATFYAIYAIAYEKTGKHKEGRDMFDKLTLTRMAMTPDGASHVVPYMLLTGSYEEALKRINEQEKVYTESDCDTVNFYYAHSLLMNKARALQGLGHYEEAIKTSMRAYSLAEKLSRRMKTQNAAWMSEKLGKKIMGIYIDRKEHELQANKLVIIGLTLCVIICISLIVRIQYDNKTIRKKNDAATRLVNELSDYKDKLFEVIERKNEVVPAAIHEDDANYNPQDHAIFSKIEKTIFNNKLFLKPRLSRQEVADHAGISLGRFNSTFSRYSSMTFVNYINNLRVEYAARLLKENKNYSIEAIAHECGLPVRQTFYRLFTKRYGITPAEYRSGIGNVDGDNEQKADEK